MAAPMPPCGRCGAAAAPYTCPRCNRRLCSLGCYRGHGACAEAFYREQVLQALAAERGVPPPGRGRVRAALGRLRELPEAGDPQAALGRGLWGRLSRAERAEFGRLVRSGEALGLLPPWRPWWWRRGRPEGLVEELGPGEGEEAEKEAEKVRKVDREAKKAEEVDEKDKGDHEEDERDVGDEEEARKDKMTKKEAKMAKKSDREAKKAKKEDKKDKGDHKEDMEAKKEAKIAKKEAKIAKKEAKMAKGDWKDEEEDVEDEEDNGDEEEDEDNRGMEVNEEDDDEGLAGPMPPLPAAVPPLRSLCAAPPSPLLRFQLPNVLYGYAFALSLHHGDEALLPEMAAAALASAASLRCRRPFASTAEALHDARREAEAAGYPRCPLGSAGTVLAVAQLLRGRSRRRPAEDAEAALHHLGRLLGAARRRLRGEDEERGRLGRARKKCLYLLAWSRERGGELAALAEEARQVHAEVAAAEAEVEALRRRLEGSWGGPRPPAARVMVEELP
ncbi:zinc finger HIT domain-containing protein 2-like [Anser cygnoides]|uniref:zinc finger HIT domain-containing protein 2-like n=1 Tax=Anser cygnoides TaxID=8845 RepID=UPI0034D35DDA